MRTLEEVAEIMGVSRQTAKNIEISALRKLKAALSEDVLD